MTDEEERLYYARGGAMTLEEIQAELDGPLDADGFPVGSTPTRQESPVQEEESATAGPLAVELDDFLGDEPPPYDWLVPGLLERGDRVILTGGEGRGKSTLMRQWAVQLACGVHPFGGASFAPLRVLLWDLENGQRQIHRKIHPMREYAGNAYRGGLLVRVQPEGLDFTQGDGELFEAVIAEAKPDVVVTGPSYKMVAGDPTEEGPARLAASWIDKVRTRYGCAFILEAHSPHGSQGAKRPTRPYGASLWLRWPEFGLHLGEDGELSHWRGPRDERDWPSLLQRGGPWPWTAVTDERDLLWAHIRRLCVERGDHRSQRDLANETGASQSTVSRTIREHQLEWDALAKETRGNAW